MLRIAQILHSQAHWIFEDDTIPVFPSDANGEGIVLIDITEHPEIQEGWDYNVETNEFTEPIIPEPEVHPTPEYVAPDPTIQEEILYETKYQTMILEMGGMM